MGKGMDSGMWMLKLMEADDETSARMARHRRSEHRLKAEENQSYTRPSGA